MTTEQKLREALYSAAIYCPLKIDHGSVTLFYDEKQPGIDALAQLVDRLLSAALAQPPAPEQQAPQEEAAKPEPCNGLGRSTPWGCKNRHQCWEPCGELGHSEEHAKPAPAETQEAAKPETEQAKMVEKIINGVREFYLGFLSRSLPHSEIDRVRSASVTRDAIEAVIDRFSTLLAADSKAGGEPLFWVRFCSNGMYEGPLHNAQIETVRKESGAWVPLYTRPQQQAKPLKTFGDAVAWIERRRDKFLSENSSSDPETGAVEFGRGARATAAEEYVFELDEIIEGLRAHGIGDQA